MREDGHLDVALALLAMLAHGAGGETAHDLGERVPPGVALAGAALRGAAMLVGCPC